MSSRRVSQLTAVTSRVPQAVGVLVPTPQLLSGMCVGVWLDLLRGSFILGKLLFFPGLVGCHQVLSIKFYWNTTIPMMYFL